MKNLKHFILGMLTIIVFEPIINSLVEIVCGWLETFKTENTKKVLKANKEIQDLQIELDGYHDDTQAIGFQCDSEEYYEDDEEWEDKLTNKIGF